MKASHSQASEASTRPVGRRSLRHEARVSLSAVPVGYYRKLKAGFSGIATAARRIAGIPDYQAYLAHMISCHPDETPLDPLTFEKDRMNARYNRPGARCC